MAEINWIAVGVCSFLMFAGGAVWHGPLFGKIWMKIHHGDKTFTKEENKELMKGMWKLLVTEAVASLLMVIGLACIMGAIPEFSVVRNAFMIWLAFVLPTLTSTVIWGGDKKEYMLTKIAITGSYRLIALLAIGYILSVWR
jgi:Protein of unknown function (DUF1761)